MATPTDPTFGAGFDADAFRSAIRSTMEMGLPGTVAERATFRWNSSATYSAEDVAHNPFDWTDTPLTEVTHADVLIPVAVEFSARPAGSLDTPLGQFDNARVVVTVLDTDFASVQGADEILLGENSYTIDFWGPPVGLFDVTIYTVYATATDEA
jgi:hypothetical protein